MEVLQDILTATELWNGTAWTSNTTSMSTARNYAGAPASAGTQTAGLYVRWGFGWINSITNQQPNNGQAHHSDFKL
jgi:hypothetical protein